jgi:hypothetical protein
MTEPHHPSRLELERLVTDDLRAAARDTLDEHVSSCAPCGAYMAELRAAHAERLARVPPSVFLDRHRQRRRRWLHRAILGWTGGVVTAVAATVLLFRLPHRADQIRFKGAGISVYRKRGDQVQVMTASDRVRSGDALRVVLTLGGPARLWVAAVDASGRIDPLVPGGLIELAAGEQPLPESAVVESPCVDMWLIAWPAVLPAEAEVSLRRMLPSLRGGAASFPTSALVQSVRCE